MQLQFIGTASGKVSLKRFHSSLLFSTEKKKILIDAGDEISQALLAQNISYNEIDAIIITHFHADHLAGLPLLLTQMKIFRRKKPLRIYVHKNLLKRLNEYLQTGYLFVKYFKFEVKLAGYNFDRKKSVDENFSFIAKQNTHIWNKHKIRNRTIDFVSSSFLFITEKKKIIYTSDIGSEDDLYLFANVNADCFITEATHVKISEIKKLIRKRKYKSIILTHYDDEQIETLRNVVKELKKTYTTNVILAKDKMRIVF